MHHSSYTHKQVNLVLSGYGEIRVTPDGRYSIFDVVEVIGGKKNPRDAWKALTEQFPEAVEKSDSYKFPGRGQQFTLVADKASILYIIGLLPGAVGRSYREEAAKLMLAKIEGTQQPTPNNSRLEGMTVQDELIIFDYAFQNLEKTGIERNLLESARLTSLSVRYPSMAPALASAKEVLMLNTPDEGQRYSPTELGRILAVRLGREKPIRAVEINQALKQAGLQTSEHQTTSKGEKRLVWHLTQEGETYGRVFLESAQGSNKTISVIWWLNSVLDQLQIEE